MKKIIEFSHYLFCEYINKDDIVIDLTVGNGNDTLFLVKISKFVYGFDIQKAACEKTITKLNEFNNYVIINDSHINFLKYVNESFKGAVFNLGYLPNGNKDISTTADITVKTLDIVLKNIEVQGICVIVVYPGHEEGYKESIVLDDYLKNLDQKQYDVIEYKFINQINNPPYLYAIRRLK